MSEIDKPENQSAEQAGQPEDAAAAGAAPVWPAAPAASTAPAATTAEPQSAAWQRPADASEEPVAALPTPDTAPASPWQSSSEEPPATPVPVTQTSASAWPSAAVPANSPGGSPQQAASIAAGDSTYHQAPAAPWQSATSAEQPAAPVSATPWPGDSGAGQSAPVSAAPMQSGDAVTGAGTAGAAAGVTAGQAAYYAAAQTAQQEAAAQTAQQGAAGQTAQHNQGAAGQTAPHNQGAAGQTAQQNAAGYWAGSAQPSNPAAPGQGQPGDPGYPAWTPPTSTPRKGVPTAVKVLVGGVAALSLALCSGVTGAFVATAIADKDFSLPVSTADTAPVVDRSSLAGVAAKTQASVVSIATSTGEGSGVVLTADGYILTNNHVVEGVQGGSVTVTLSNGKKVKAKVVGTDPKTDLAVVKAEATDLQPATLADSDKAVVGDTVLAIGSPLGLQGSVTSGIISAKDRTIRAGTNNTSLSGLLQTDAPINPGNSGGALVNMNGEVVGINTAIATSGNGDGNIGVGFAIPSKKAKQVAEQLINGQKVSHPFLGVSVTAEENGGAKIGTMSPNSPAVAAGLQEGDVITKFGDRVINDSDDLVSAVQSGTVGQKVSVEFTRNGEKKTATVTLGEAS